MSDLQDYQRQIDELKAQDTELTKQHLAAAQDEAAAILRWNHDVRDMAFGEAAKFLADNQFFVVLDKTRGRLSLTQDDRTMTFYVESGGADRELLESVEIGYKISQAGSNLVEAHYIHFDGNQHPKRDSVGMSELRNAIIERSIAFIGHSLR